MANESNSLGDTKVYQATMAIYNRIRAAIETIAYQAHVLVNLTRQLQGFIPCLKRADKDLGGLPFYSRAYTSQKTNREHCLMCIISFLVQEFWDYRESVEEFGEERLKKLEEQLTLLEAIAADGLSIYRVTGKFPGYYLITKAELDDEETRAREIETLKLEQAKDDEEDYQAAVDHETGADLGNDDEAAFALTQDGLDDMGETETGEELTGDNHEDDGDDKVEGYLVEDEFDAEAAARQAQAEPSLDAEALRRQAQDDDGEPHLGLEPLIETDTTPPMPSEENE